MGQVTRECWRCDDYDAKRGAMCEHEWLKDPDPVKPPPGCCARCKSINWNKGHATRTAGVPAKPAGLDTTEGRAGMVERVTLAARLKLAADRAELERLRLAARLAGNAEPETGPTPPGTYTVADSASADRGAVHAANAGSHPKPRPAHAVGCKCYLCRAERTPLR